MPVSIFQPGTAAVSAPLTVVHVGSAGTLSLSVANTAAAGADSEALVASLSTVTGGFQAQPEQTAPIAAGTTDTTSLALGFSTASAGTITGTAVLSLVSDGNVVSGDTAGLTSLGTLSVPITAVVDNYATAAITQVSGAGTLTALNGFTYASSPDAGAFAYGPNGGLYSDLGATVLGSGGVAETLVLNFASAQSAVSLAFAVGDFLAANGGDGVTLTDSNGATATAAAAIPSGSGDLFPQGTVTLSDAAGFTSVTIAATDSSGAEALAVSGIATVPEAYVLDLGTVLQGASVAPAATLAVANAATGAADLLAGSFSESGDTGAFINSGLAAFSGLAAGGAANPAVSLSTAQAGTFTETVTLAATGSNTGYAAALTPQVITVVGTVAAVPTVSWLNDAPGNWSSAGQWSGGAVPNAGDIAVIDFADDPRLSHASGNDIAGGLLNQGGDLAVTGGTLAFGQIDNRSRIDLDGGVLALDSDLGFSAIFTNEAGAVLFTAGGGADLAVIGSGAGTLDNAGVLAAYDGSGVTNIDAAVANSGYIQVQSGTLSLNGGGNSNGSHLYVAGGAVLQFGTTASGSSNTFTVTGGTYTGDTAINGGTLDLSAAATAIFPTSLNVSAGALLLGANNAAAQIVLRQTGGTIDGSGTLQSFGSATLTGGKETGSGITVLQGGGSIGGSFEIDTGRTVQNNLWLNWTSGNILLNGGTLSNDAIFYVTGGARLQAQGTAVFDNAAGAVTAVFAGSGVANVDAAVANSGYLQVQSGTLSLNGGGTSDGSHLFVGGGAVLQFGTTASGAGNPFTVTGGTYAGDTAITGGTLDLSAAAKVIFPASLNVSAGTLQLGTNDAAAQIGLVQIGGTIDGSGTLQAFGSATLTGGFETGSGVTVLQGGGSIGGSFEIDAGRTVQNNAWLNWAAGNILLNGGTLSNDAIFYVTADARIQAQGSAVFNNAAGAITAVFAGSDVTNIDAATVNSGYLQVQSGTLSLNGGGSSNGSHLYVAGGAVLQFGTTASGSSSTFTVTGGTYAGDTAINGGTLDLSAAAGAIFPTSLDVSAGALLLGANNAAAQIVLRQTGGTIDGSGTLLAFGSATLTGGKETGSGITVLQGGGIGGSIEIDTGRTVQNNAWLNWTSGNILLNGGTLGNDAIFYVTADARIQAQGSAVFDNAAGAVTAVFAGSGVANVDAAVANSGYIQVQSGTLSLNGGGTSDGSHLYVAGGAVLQLGTTASGSSNTFTVTGGTYAGDTAINGGTLDLSAANANFPTVTVSAGALLLGAGDATVQNAFIQTAGTIDGSGVVEVIGSATLAGGLETGSGTTVLNGVSTLSGSVAIDGGRTVENDQMLTWTGGTLTLGGGTGISDPGATLNNRAGAVLSIDGDGAIITQGAGSIVNAGIILKQGGIGSTTISASLANSGTVEVASGTLAFTGAVSGDGTFILDGTATLEFATGVGPNSSLQFLHSNEVLETGATGLFGATIAGFGTGDTIDAGSVSFSATETVGFVADLPGPINSGTVTVSDGTHNAAFGLVGNYSTTGTFHLASDGHGGTAITFG